LQRRKTLDIKVTNLEEGDEVLDGKFNKLSDEFNGAVVEFNGKANNLNKACSRKGGNKQQ